MAKVDWEEESVFDLTKKEEVLTEAEQQAQEQSAADQGFGSSGGTTVALTDMRSTNYRSAIDGWILRKNGDSEFNQIRSNLTEIEHYNYTSVSNVGSGNFLDLMEHQMAIKTLRYDGEVLKISVFGVADGAATSPKLRLDYGPTYGTSTNLMAYSFAPGGTDVIFKFEILITRTSQTTFTFLVSSTAENGSNVEYGTSSAQDFNVSNGFFVKCDAGGSGEITIYSMLIEVLHRAVVI